ncbi:MAG: hypothetical protein Q3999_03095, partial [Buchananella hordeovulneris]|nr:hypothetical protein [Buchananella hordeovulneris]
NENSTQTTHPNTKCQKSGAHKRRRPADHSNKEGHSGDVERYRNWASVALYAFGMLAACTATAWLGALSGFGGF